MEYAVSNNMAALAKSAASRCQRQRNAVDQTEAEIAELHNAIRVANSPQVDIDDIVDQPPPAEEEAMRRSGKDKGRKA